MEHHPSFGRVPPDAFREAMAAPAGTAHDILRKYEPSFGIKSADGGELVAYKVTVTRRIMTTESAHVTVKAVNEEEATEVVYAMPETSFCWDQDGYSEPEGGFEVEDIEEA